jgi:hypothetical protein
MSQISVTDAERDLLSALCQAYIDFMTGDPLAISRLLANMTDVEAARFVALAERIDPAEWPDPPTVKLNW